MELFISIFIISTASYLLASTAGLFSEKSGVVNIAIEGMMIMGALTYSLFLKTTDPNSDHSYMQYIALIAVMLVGIIFSLILSLGAVTFMGDNIIVGTAINILAPGLAILITKALNNGNELIKLGNYQDMQVFGKSGHFYIFLAISFLIIIATWFVFNKTKFGLRIKAAGENPNALAAAGVNVNKIRYQSLMISGALAALAGAFAVNIVNTFTGNMNGMGYIAIALLIMSQWNILYIPLSSLLFSIIYALSYSYLTLSFLQDVPKIIFDILPFLLPIITMMIFKSKGAPNSLGKPYNKEQR